MKKLEDVGGAATNAVNAAKDVITAVNNAITNETNNAQAAVVNADVDTITVVNADDIVDTVADVFADAANTFVIAAIDATDAVNAVIIVVKNS